MDWGLSELLRLLLLGLDEWLLLRTRLELRLRLSKLRLGPKGLVGGRPVKLLLRGRSLLRRPLLGRPLLGRWGPSLASTPENV